ncbi:MAG: hypothetical protein R3E01_03020 [Pirellulaceae bacterium]|nr:SGNH/GDSL hydrolase family protein [Planctomycetales bacterium]
MTSSIFSSNPLVRDLVQQKRHVYQLVLKSLLLVALVLAVDRLVDAYLLQGLRQYYGLDRNVTVACIGHSRTVLGIDDVRLAKELRVPVAKFAVQGAGGADRLAMARYLVSQQHATLRLVCLDVSAYTFDDSGLSANSYKLFYPLMDEPEIASHIQACQPDSHEWLVRCVLHSARYNEANLGLALRGRWNRRENLKRNRLDLDDLRRRMQSPNAQQMRVDERGEHVFEETLDFLTSRQLQVVLVYIPTVDVLNEVDPVAHDRIRAMLAAAADARPNVFYLDYNCQYQHQHELFADGIHMNADGQRVVTDRLAKDLLAILTKGSPPVPADTVSWRATGQMPSAMAPDG